MNRRQFIFAASAAAGLAVTAPAARADADPDIHDGYGVLVDTTECIGCRKCEWACARENKLTDKPVEAFEDKSVFERPRRMGADAYTVVNRYEDVAHPDRPPFVKVQCMHCLRPACASACLVGAMRRRDNGAVTYDSWKCIGCRYCMVACPFQVPAYQYDNAFTPKVSKCSFCFARLSNGSGIPACVEICPPMCLTYAKRVELLALAHEKIRANSGRYVDHVYGERELGGTSWLYLTSVPVNQLGLLEFGEKPIPEYTEPLQHGIFKYGLPPLLLFGFLAAAMKTYQRGEPE